MAVKVITPPVGYPVSLADLKAHLRVKHSSEDTLIETYLAAATDYAQTFLGRALITQTLELVLDKFPAIAIEIPRPPLQQVVSVTYDDVNGDPQTLVAGTDYVVDNVSEPAWIAAVNATWPAPIDAINSVRVRYIAGYGSAGNSPAADGVPFGIKAAIMLLAGTMYAHRETVVVGVSSALVPWSAEQLLREHRVELSLA